MSFKRFLIKLVINSIAVMACAYILPGVTVTSYFIAILAALILALLNAFVKPILILFTLPATIFTFGLFLLVVNALIIMMADFLVDGFYVDGFWWALIFSLLLSFFTYIMEKVDETPGDQQKS